MPIAALIAVLFLAPQESPLVQAWAVEVDDIILGTPVVHEDLVIVASMKGTVAAFKIDGGEPAWSVNAKGSVLSGMALIGDKLFVPAGESSLVLNAKTGKVFKDKAPKATRVIVGGSRLYLLASLEYQGGYVLGFSDDIAAYELPSCRSLWREAPCRLGVTTAVESGSFLYVASQYHLYALDAKTGKELGMVVREKPKVPGVPYHGVADKERVIFLAEQVTCYNPKNLKETWNAPVKGLLSWMPPVLTPDRLIVFPLPNVVALDLKTGKEEWTLKLEGDPHFCTTAPPVRGKEICVGFNGKLFAVDAVAGKVSWTMDTGKVEPPVPVPQPAWAGDRLVYAVGKRVLCLKAK